MARKKDSDGLLEIIARTRSEEGPSPLGVPDWMKGKPPGPPQTPDQQPPAPQQAKPPPRATPWRPVLLLREARITISLNYVSCGVVILALLTLLVGVFVLGRHTAPSAPPTQGGTPPSYAPGVLGQGGHRLTPPPVTSHRTPGKYYLVIEGLGGKNRQHWKDAEAIVALLKEKGLPADIGQMRDPNQYVVWSLKPFDSPDSRQANEYAERIKALGREHRARLGAYDLVQTNTVGDWPWFHQYRPTRP